MANEEGKSKLKYTPSYLLEDIEAKGNFKNTAIKSTAQVLIGVGGGAIGTAILGKYAFITGLGLIGLGNYKGISWMTPLGSGMMASSLMLAEDAVGLSGTEGFDLKTEASKAKQRLLKLKENFLSHTYLDKVFKKKAATTQKQVADKQKVESDTEDDTQEVKGLNDVPASTELDNIEKQLMASAMAFQKKQQGENQVEGVDPELMGLEAEVDFSNM
jgi:hypothetical protein